MYYYIYEKMLNMGCPGISKHPLNFAYGKIFRMILKYNIHSNS